MHKNNLLKVYAMYKKSAIFLSLFLYISHSYSQGDKLFERIIADTPKAVAAQSSYKLYTNGVLTEAWYYNGSLSLAFIKGDVNAFLDSGKFASEEECFVALLEAISLRYLNLSRAQFNTNSWLQNNYNYQEYNVIRDSMNVKKVQYYLNKKWPVSSPSSDINRCFIYLKKALKKRIRNIEYQLKHQLRFDYAHVCYALMSLIGSGLSAYFGYSEYEKIAEYPVFCDMLKKSGVITAEWRNSSYSYTGARFPIKSEDNEVLFKKYLKLKRAKEDGYVLPIVMSCISVGLALYAYELFKIARNPNRDNEYLPYYKKLLAFICYLEKHGYDDWTIAKND